MAAYSCAEHRAEAMARLAGELSALAQERFDAHQRVCAPCRAFVELLALALASARAEPALLSAAERDREYAALVARLDDAARPGQADTARLRRRRRWLGPAATVAALGLSAAAVLLIVRSSRGAGEPPEGELVAVSPGPGLDVRAVSGTEWNLDDADGETTLVLRRGTVYVRFAALVPGRSLHVRAPGLRVRVTGTIFAVRSEPGRPAEVAVLRGSVAVERDGGGSATLVTDEASLGAGMRGVANRRDYAPVRDWLAETSADRAGAGARSSMPMAGPAEAEAQATMPIPGGPAPAVAPVETSHMASPPAPVARSASRVAPAGAATSAGQTSPPPTYVDAERALAADDPAAAAAVLERLIAVRPDGFDADTARLELATLYAERLERPDDARRHLREFLRRHTAGPGVATATALLCRLEPGHPPCISR